MDTIADPANAGHDMRGDPQMTGPRGAPDRSTARTWPLWLAMLIFGSTLIDVVFFTGFVGSDDRDYFVGGMALFEGTLGPKIELAETRLTLLAWNGLMVHLLGPFAQRVAASYILLHQMLNVATFVLGRRLFGPRPALVGVYLFALMPLMIIYSSTMLPDIPSALFLVMTLLALSFALPSQKVVHPAVGTAWMSLAGFLFGVAYGAKESVLVTLPALFIWGLLQVRYRQPQRWIAWSLAGAGLFASGLLLFVILETAVYSSATDRLFLRLGWTIDDGYGPTQAMVDKYGTNPIERWNWLIFRSFDRHTLPHAHKWLMLICFAAFPFLHGRGWLVYVLPIWIFAFFTWGSVSPTRYAPPSLQARYYIVVLPFVALIVGFVCTRLLEWFESWRVPVLAGPFALAILIGPWLYLRGPNCLPSVVYRADLVGAGMHAVDEARRSGERPPIVVATHVEQYLQPVRGAHWENLVASHEMSLEQFREQLAVQSVRYVTLHPDQVYPRYERILSHLDRMLLPMLRTLGSEGSGNARAAVVSDADGRLPDLRVRCRSYRLSVGRIEGLWRYLTKEPRLSSEAYANAIIWLVEIELAAGPA